MITRRRLTQWLSLCFVALASVTCGGGDSIILPSEGVPAKIAILKGNGQTGVVGQPLTDTLIVRITDSKDRPVQNQAVRFLAAGGAQGSDLVPDTAFTDADGQARSKWVLGTVAGAQTVQARVLATGTAGQLTANFNATAGAAAPDTIFVVKGNLQTAPVSSPLTDSLIVRITDHFGNPLSGLAVAWSVGGGGQVSASTVPTAADGTAGVRRTLGPTAGTQTTAATFAGVHGSPVVFTSTATPGGATGLIKVFGDGQSASVGFKLTDSLVIQVKDANGNGVPGRNVNWVVTTTSDSARPLSSITDANGKAFTFWYLGGAAGARTLTAAVSGLPQVSFGATGLASQPTRITANSTTSLSGTAGSPVLPAPSVKVTDQSNNPVQGETVTFVVISGGGLVSDGTGLNDTVTVATDVNGIATLASWTLGPLTGANAVDATAKTAGGVALTGSPVHFTATASAGAASRLGFVQQPTNVVAGAAFSPAVTVAIQDANGNTVTGSTAPVTLAIGTNAGGGTLGGTVTANAVAGIATFNGLSIDKTGTGYTLTASSGALTPSTSAGFDVTPGTPSRLAFVQEPTSVASGVPITPSVQVAVQDANGNLVPTANAAVTIALGSNPTGAVLSGTLTATPVAGVATFANLSLDKAGTGFTLAASATGLNGATSVPFNVGSGTPARLAFTVQPTNTTAGANIAPPVEVTLQDAQGNTVTSSTATVSLALGANPGGSTLAGTIAVAAVAGVATFSNLSLNKVGSGYTLVAASAGLTNDTSAPFDVAVGSGHQLVFTQQPTSALAGAAIAPAIQLTVEDGNGNPVTTSTAAITLSIANNAGGGVLSGGGPVSAVAGVATFSGVSIDKIGTGYTLAASATGIASATSSAFDIGAGSPSKLAVTQQPTTTGAGAAITPAIQVRIEDAGGNLVSTATDPVTVALGSNPGGSTLSGTTTVNAVGGVASFPGLSLNKAGTGYTLTLASGTLTGTTTTAFDITAGTPTQLVILQQPTSTVAGQAIAPAVMVALEDQLGNIVVGSSATVSVALGNNPGSGALSGTTSLNAINGVATFSGLSVNRTGTGYTLVASSGSLPSVTSTGFDITAGVASHLAFTVQPASATAGAAFAPTITVEVQDASGNRVPGATDVVTLAIGTNAGGGTLGGTTLVGATAGTAAFPGVSIDKAGTGYTLTASAPNLTGATSTAFNISPAAASQLVFIAQPSNTVAGAIMAPPVQVALKDGLGNTVTGSSSPVTLSIGTNPASGVLSGTLTVNAASGVATFADLRIDKAGAGYTLHADASGLPQATSSAFDVSAGNGNHLAFIVQPSNAAVGANIVPAIQVAVEDGSNNVVTTATDSIRLTLTPPGALGGTIGTHAVNGVATFGNVTVSRAGTGYTLTAFAPVTPLVSATSTAFDIIASATTSTITADTPDPSRVGQGYTVSFSVTASGGTPTGTVTVSDGLDSCQGALASGAGSCTLVSTTAGAKTLSASYAGDGNFAPSVSPGVAHTVTQAATTTIITGDNADPSVSGETVMVTWVVTVSAPGNGTPTGTVTISVNDGSGATCSAPVASGGCQLVLPLVGAKTLTASYGGDANFSGSADTEPHTVNKAATSAVITAHTPNPSTVGQAIAVSFAVTASAPGSGTPTGNVTVSDGTGATCTATVAAGGCSLVPTAAGAKTLVATYAGDVNYTGSTSAGVAHTVGTGSTTTTITAHTPNPSAVGQAIAVSFSVTASGGTPTGNVVVDDGTGDTCSGTVAQGGCSLTATTPGSKTLTATYAGDVNFAGSVSAGVAQTVNLAATTTTITGHTPNPSVTGQGIVVAFTVTSTGGTPTGNVTVATGTGATCIATVAQGTCTLVTTTAGAKTLTATYAGDANFSGSVSSGVAHTVNPAATTTTITAHTPNPSALGAGITVNYSVTVSAPGSGTPTGNVTVSDGTASCIGTVTAGTCTLTPTSAGAKTLTASYAGDANFSGGTSAGVAHTVTASATTTVITGNAPNPAVVGQGILVNFSVTGSGGTPTGDVTVTDGTGGSCIGTVAAASCTLTALSAGTKTLTASYGGDANFNPSTSAGVAQTVNQAATATTLTGHTPNPSVVGQTIVVTFSVTSTGGTPTGNVTVATGTGATCTGTVAQGTCNLVTTTAGAKTLTATYAGDANFSGSTSAGVSHTVNQASTTTTITAHTPDPSSLGSGITVNFSVAVTAPGSGTPTGNVTVSDGTASCIGTVAAGTCSLTPLTAGAKTLTATYAGDANFTTSTSPGVGHTVNASTTTTTITGHTPNPATVGQPIAVSFTVAGTGGTPTGNVTVDDGTGDSCIGTVAAGTCNLTATTAGAKILTATYAGDASFGGSVSAGVSHTVTAASTTTNITTHTPNPVPLGQPITVSFAVTSTGGTPTGNVTIDDGTGDSCIGTVAAGSCQLTPTTAGVKTLSASYAGDGNFAPSSATGITHTVTAAATTTTITGHTPSPSTLGGAIAVSFTVTSTAGTPTGNVTVSDGTGGSCVGTVAAGGCSLTPLTAGAKNLVATYGGDLNFAVSSSPSVAHTVNPAASATTITAHTPNPSVIGQAISVSFSVTSTAGTPTGNVTVDDGTGDTCIGTVAQGGCSLTPTTSGAKTLTATYAGDANFTGSAGTAPHQVDPFGPVSASHSLVAVSAGSVVASTGTSTVTITVTARDAFDNLISGASVGFFSTGSSNSLSPATASTGSGGTATSDFSSTTAEAKTISATANGVTLNQTQGVTVTPDVADPAFTTAAVPNGAVFTPTTIRVTSADQFGNLAISGGRTVVVTVSGSNSAGPLTATDNGDGTYTTSYTPLVIGTDNLDITLDGTAISGSPYSSTVGLLPGSQLVFTVQPVDTKSGHIFNPHVSVAIEDGSGNIITAATDPITVAIGNNPSGGSLTGTLTVNAVNGVAVFTDLGITGSPAPGYTLTANGASMPQATSATFRIK